MSQLVLDMWVDPLLAGASKEFVGLTFPKMLVYVGSPAFKLDGSRVLGQAEGGTLIRFTEVNFFDESNVGWINTQMHTAFHEYGHIIHQRFGFPNDYREVTPDTYTKSGWRTVDSREALQKGVVSSYGTKSFQEDFVELFATYIIGSEAELKHLFVDVTDPSPEEAKDNAGRAILREKLSIQQKYMTNVGIDMDAVRTAYQTRITEKAAQE